MKEPKPSGFIRRNALSLVLTFLFIFTLVGHVWTGFAFANIERAQHGLTDQTFNEFLHSGEYWSTLFENWESEYLQMGLFVLLAAKLRQYGSGESRPFNHKQEQQKKDKIPVSQQPWPLRAGGWQRRVYENSLSIALLGLFAASFTGHLISSWRQALADHLLHGQQPIGLAEYITSARFWYESFQNWQSEFLAVLSLILLSIMLRQKDSPQSKQLEAPNSHTGH